MAIPKSKLIKRPAYHRVEPALPDAAISPPLTAKPFSDDDLLQKTVGLSFNSNPVLFRQAFDVLSLWFMLGFLSGAIGILLVLGYFF